MLRQLTMKLFHFKYNLNSKKAWEAEKAVAKLFRRLKLVESLFQGDEQTKSNPPGRDYCVSGGDESLSRFFLLTMHRHGERKALHLLEKNFNWKLDFYAAWRSEVEGGGREDQSEKSFRFSSQVDEFQK